MLAKPISAQAKRATMNMSGVPAGRMRAMYLSGTNAQIGTKRIEGRLTASQIAAASAASFLFRRT